MAIVYLLMTSLAHYFPHEVQATILTTRGRDFVLALPKLVQKEKYVPCVFFDLMTWHEKPIKVNITTAEYNIGVPLNHVVEIMYIQSARYQLPQQYMSEIDEGRKFSYRFRSLKTFELSAIVHSNPWSVATIKFLPIVSWGHKYFVYTFGQEPSIQVVTGKWGVTVTAKLQMTPDTCQLEIYQVIYRHGETLEFKLLSYEAFSISACWAGINRQFSLTGTTFQGDKPIGVISGSCDAIARRQLCDTVFPANSTVTDIASDMMLPAEAAGTEFYLFISLPLIGSAMRVRVIPLGEQTILNFSSDQTPFNWLNVVDTPLEFEIFVDTQLKASRNVIVIGALVPACWRESDHHYFIFENFGDVGLFSFVPNRLFYNAYHWRHTAITIFKHLEYAVVVFEKGRESAIWINEVNIHKYMERFPHEILRWNWNTRLTSYHTIIVTTSLTNNELLTDDYSPIGCYLFGYAEFMAYITFAGIHDCEDDDCGGRLLKTEIDESFVQHDHTQTPVSASVTWNVWSSWSSWTCNTTGNFFLKTRVCTNTSPGENGTTCEGNAEEIWKKKCLKKALYPSIYWLLVTLIIPVGLLITWRILLKKRKQQRVIVASKAESSSSSSITVSQSNSDMGASKVDPKSTKAKNFQSFLSDIDDESVAASSSIYVISDKFSEHAESVVNSMAGKPKQHSPSANKPAPLAKKPAPSAKKPATSANKRKSSAKKPAPLAKKNSLKSIPESRQSSDTTMSSGSYLER